MRRRILVNVCPFAKYLLNLSALFGKRIFEYFSWGWITMTMDEKNVQKQRTCDRFFLYSLGIKHRKGWTQQNTNVSASHAVQRISSWMEIHRATAAFQVSSKIVELPYFAPLCGATPVAIHISGQ